MTQYEIRWANLPQPHGRRPVLLLSRPNAYRYLTGFMVAEITTTIRNIPQEVRVGRREGLFRPSVANLDNVQLIVQARLGELIGTLAKERHVEVKRALGWALDWVELKSL